MELAKRITGVLYIDRTVLTYIDTSVGGMVSYQYTPDVISDLEIVNEDVLFEQISQLIQTNTISPTQMVIFLSPSVLFEKKILTNPTDATKQDTIEKFVETVPFETVSYTTFTLSDGVQVIAANETFFTSLKDAFEKQGFQVMGIFPADVFQEDLSAGVQVDLAVRLLGKIDSMKQYNLLAQKSVILPEKKTVPQTTEKKSKNRTYILAGVFVGLVLVLIVMLLLQK